MIIANCRPLVHVSRLIRIGNEATGSRVTVTVADNRGRELVVQIFPSDLISSFPRFQRALLRAGGVYFSNQAFSKGAGRARRWRRLVDRLIAEAGR